MTDQLNRPLTLVDLELAFRTGYASAMETGTDEACDDDAITQFNNAKHLWVKEPNP